MSPRPGILHRMGSIIVLIDCSLDYSLKLQAILCPAVVWNEADEVLCSSGATAEDVMVLVWQSLRQDDAGEGSRYLSEISRNDVESLKPVLYVTLDKLSLSPSRAT